MIVLNVALVDHMMGELIPLHGFLVKPRKISWARNDSARYWFHSALKKS